MNFWTALAAFVGATALVYLGLSLNGKTEHAGGHGHGHGHGHDDHGHGHGHGHGHH